MIRYCAGVALCAALFALLSYADAGATDPGGEREALIALEREWIDAEIGKDRETLERIFHERFISTFRSGRTVGRDAYIDFILGVDLEPFTVSGHQIEIFGDTAVVVDTLDGGDTKFTWVAIRRDGRWRVIAQTFSPNPDQAPTPAD